MRLLIKADKRLRCYAPSPKLPSATSFIRKPLAEIPHATLLNGKAYLGFRTAGIAVPPRVLEIGKNVVGTSEITGEKCPNIGKF